MSKINKGKAENFNLVRGKMDWHKMGKFVYIYPIQDRSVYLTKNGLTIPWYYLPHICYTLLAKLGDQLESSAVSKSISTTTAANEFMWPSCLFGK